MFWHAVEMIDHRHTAPADAKGGMHVGLGPVHHCGQLVPIGHVVEVEMFDGRAGDDQPVEFFTADIAERAVEALHMIGGRVAGLMIGHADQAEFDLQRRGADQAGKLCFGLDLLGHQVQQADAQRADVLTRGQFLVHHHDAFGRQHVDRRAGWREV